MNENECALLHDEAVLCPGMSKATRAEDCIDWQLTPLGPLFYVFDGTDTGLAIRFCPFCGAKLTQTCGE